MDDGEEKCFRLWDAITGKAICCWSGHSQGVSSSAISPDGKFLVSVGEKSTLVWKLVPKGSEKK